MRRSIEYNIRFKAAAIYVIVAVGVVATILYLNSLRKDVSTQRSEIAHRRVLLAAANQLIFEVSEAQSFSSLYLSQKNRSHLAEYRRSLDAIGALIDTIILLKPSEADKLHRIDSLLRQQARNITTLNRHLAGQNPVAVINERLQEYETDTTQDTLHTVTIQNDTVVSELPRKGFFKRIGEVFKPDRKPVKIVVDRRTDTIRTPADSLPIIREMSDIAQKAQTVYDLNIRTIEARVGGLISTDKNIAAEVSALLLEFHEDTLESTLAIIGESEREIGRNYVYSTIAGVVALLLILVFTVLIITDINKGARARCALEEANARIRQVMDSRHRLLLSVSHDIKTPLNSIMSYLEQLDDQPDVRSMRNSSAHILALLENLLGFSSLEKGAVQMSSSDFCLGELCREIYDLFLPLAAQKTLTFSFDVDPVRITTDRVKLKQIVINLVSNAIKYTACGQVAWSVRFDGRELTFQVCDTGAGIPADKLSELFQPFTRVEQNNALADGTGLGMFVVKGLTELLGGRIDVESEVGRGTTVCVTLPASPACREVPKGAKRLRIFDDDPVILAMLARMLSGLGHRVVGADDACDLILTDLEMGDISGEDILREAGDVPVVVMTGRSDFSAAQAHEMGFDGFLTKPFSAATLRELVGEGVAQEDLLGDDREAILALFRTSTQANFEVLRQALSTRDYARAQALCHKMFPMFAQLGYPVEELQRMDQHRTAPYEGWQQDVERILSIRV